MHECTCQAPLEKASHMCRRGIPLLHRGECLTKRPKIPSYIFRPVPPPLPGRKHGEVNLITHYPEMQPDYWEDRTPTPTKNNTVSEISTEQVHNEGSSSSNQEVNTMTASIIQRELTITPASIGAIEEVQEPAPADVPIEQTTVPLAPFTQDQNDHSSSTYETESGDSDTWEYVPDICAECGAHHPYKPLFCNCGNVFCQQCDINHVLHCQHYN